MHAPMKMLRCKGASGEDAEIRFSFGLEHEKMENWTELPRVFERLL